MIRARRATYNSPMHEHGVRRESPVSVGFPSPSPLRGGIILSMHLNPPLIMPPQSGLMEGNLENPLDHIAPHAHAWGYYMTPSGLPIHRKVNDFQLRYNFSRLPVLTGRRWQVYGLGSVMISCNLETVHPFVTAPDTIAFSGNRTSCTDC